MLTAFRKAAVLSRIAQAVQSTFDLHHSGVVAQVRGEGGAITDDVGGSFITTGTPGITQNVTEVKIGSGAMRFTSADVLQIAGRPEMRMTGDFTVEFWMRPTAYPASGTEAAVVCRLGSGVYAPYGGFLQADGRYRAIWGNGVNGTTAGLVQLYGGTTAQKIPLNQWTHICQQRRNGMSELYVNGVRAGQSGYGQTDGSLTLPLTIARTYDGFLDHIRITNGLARYKGNFTPPTQDSYTQDGPEPYFDKVSALLKMNDEIGSSIFTDVKGRTFTAAGSVLPKIKPEPTRPGFGGRVGSFDNGGYLVTPSTPDLQMAGSNWTIEGWMYLPPGYFVVNRVHTLFQKGIVADNTFELNCSATSYNSTTAYLRLMYSLTGGSPVTVGWQVTPATLEGWHHYAWVRDGVTLRLYVDGASKGAWAINASLLFVGDAPFSIGGNAVGNDTMPNGAMLDEFRVTKGVARYTTAFTPITKEFLTHPITHTTQLLLHFDNATIGEAIADSSPLSKSVSASGITTTTDAKFGTHAVQLTGGVTEYVAAQHPRFQLGGDDFTFEFFIKASQTVNTSPGAIIAMIDTVNNDVANGGTYGGLTINANGVHCSVDGASWTVNSSNMPLGQGVFNTGNWVHMAIVRLGSKLMLFVNGVKTREVVIGLSAIYPRSPGRLQLGSSNGTNGTYVCKIDEVRFSSKALYTANFTPPADPFTA